MDDTPQNNYETSNGMGEDIEVDLLALSQSQGVGGGDVTEATSKDENHSTNSDSSSSDDSNKKADCNNDEVSADKEKKKPMGGNSYTSHEYAFVIASGIFLTFNSGYVSGSCLSGLLIPIHDENSDVVKATVNGFTGATSKAGLALADGEFKDFRFQVTMIASFVFGSIIAGVMSPTAKPYRIEPMYGPTFLLGGIFLLIASIFAALHEHSDDERPSHQFFHLVAAANGIQNGISSLYSANLIRSTHLTGAYTDIGLFTGQCIRGNKKNLWKVQVLCSLSIAFFTGGILSFFATRHFESYSLLFNAGLFLTIGLALVVFLKQQLGITIAEALFGTWTWKRVLDILNLTKADGKPVDEQYLMEVFDNIDADGNGTIEQDELYHALKDAGLEGLTRQGISLMISSVDGDQNGGISKEEWRKLVKGTN